MSNGHLGRCKTNIIPICLSQIILQLHCKSIGMNKKIRIHLSADYIFINKQKQKCRKLL